MFSPHPLLSADLHSVMVDCDNDIEAQDDGGSSSNTGAQGSSNNSGAQERMHPEQEERQAREAEAETPEECRKRIKQEADEEYNQLPKMAQSLIDECDVLNIVKADIQFSKKLGILQKHKIPGSCKYQPLFVTESMLEWKHLLIIAGAKTAKQTSQTETLKEEIKKAMEEQLLKCVKNSAKDQTNEASWRTMFTVSCTGLVVGGALGAVCAWALPLEAILAGEAVELITLAGGGAVGGGLIGAGIMHSQYGNEFQYRWTSWFPTAKQTSQEADKFIEAHEQFLTIIGPTKMEHG